MIAPTKGVSYRDMISGDQFYYGAEVVTTRGIPVPDSPTDLAGFAGALLDDPRIGWIAITDNPGGSPMLPPDSLAGQLAGHRERIVLHLTCKDMSRNAIEAAAWRYASEGFDNILAMTGDYPTTGYCGTSAPVFDLDSVSMTALLHAMNEGIQVPGRRGKIETLSKTNFFVGCAGSPFKRYERELVPQYDKIVRKVRAGAHWIICQLGYDMRKFNEIKLLLAHHGLNTPVIGNVYLLTKGVARLFNSGKLAGCVVSNELFEDVKKYAAGEDKGRKFFRELAAKQLAVFKGLGFTAGYLGGIHKPETFGTIIDMAESYGEDDWRDFIKEIQYAWPDEFFLFEHDPYTCLSAPDRIDPQYERSLSQRPDSKEVTLGYKFSRMVHSTAFTRDKALWGTMKGILGRLDAKPGVMSRMVHWAERVGKDAMYGCKDCGDCSLPDCTYLCPMTACSKDARNGPCGGSANGRCELDDKECIWARAYERLKHYGESKTMLTGPTIFRNAALMGTSSWANAYLDRDHNAPPKSKSKSKSKDKDKDKND